MTAKKGNRLCYVLFDAINLREIAALEEIVTPDIVFDFPGAGRMEGARLVLIFMRRLLGKYPELTFSVYDTIEEGNKACVLWTNKGRTNTGEDYSNSGVTFLEFREDRICFVSDYFKDTSFVGKT